MNAVAQLEPVAYVGVDWASERHACCGLGTDGRKKNAFTVEHSKDGLAKLVRRLGALGPVGRVPVAAGHPNGRLVDAILEASHPVVAVSPNAIKAWYAPATTSSTSASAPTTSSKPAWTPSGLAPPMVTWAICVSFS